MPSKAAARARSRDQNHRAWGTRFDSLTTSPTPTPPSPSSVPASPAPDASATQLAHVRTLDLFGEEALACPGGKLDWAEDGVPVSLAAAQASLADTSVPGAGATPGRKETTRMPHNASVFIGSLPPDVDEGEIVQLLSQHLSQSANIQNIKIVHDSKGGVCAFVQCETAAQAAQVVSQAQSNPQPFMGRYLRYETARAFRSLWISYRTPMHFIPCASEESEDAADVVVNDDGVRGRWVESDLPDAMRIWKPRDARFPIITYRGEARNFSDVSGRIDGDGASSDAPAVCKGNGVLFTDLKFDIETIKNMAEAFGPLESFKPYTHPAHAFADDSSDYPPGHDSDRLICMDLSVWEVKFGHRDDCISALSTLRRVPHLTVTWANANLSNCPPTPRQAASSSRHGFTRPPPQSYSPGNATSPITHSRPLLLLDCMTGNDGLRGTDTLASPIFVRSPTSLHPPKGTPLLSPPLGRHGTDPILRNAGASAVDREDTEDGWTVVRPMNITRAILSSVTDTVSDSSPLPETIPKKEGEEDIQTKSPKWNEQDFPPLKMKRGDPEEKDGQDDAQQEASLAIASHIDSVSAGPLSSEQAPPTPGAVASGEASPIGDIPNIPRPLVIHRRSSSNPVARFQLQDHTDSPHTQTLEIPPTPELDSMSLSQTPTSAQPVTPMYPDMVPFVTPKFSAGNEQESQSRESEGIAEPAYRRRQEREVDPKTIFVGGLESFGPVPWDENRLRTIFEKYGEVQDVRVVTPLVKKASFAFVTFSDEEGPLRAIRGEHNRNYDGRQIRVQLRDVYPMRGGFRFRGRGLGKPRQFGLEPHVIGAGNHTNFDRQAERNSSGYSRGQAFERILAQVDGDRTHAPFSVNMHSPTHQKFVSSISCGTDSGTLLSSNSFETNIEANLSQDSDSRTAVSLTPPPNTYSVSASASAIVSPVTPQSAPPASMGYYPPHAWASPYGAPMHYPIPIGAYGGMIPPMPMQYAAAAPGGSDLSAGAANAPIHWGHLYRAAAVPYPYPYFPIIPPSDTPRSTMSSQPPTPVKGQPPLHATGFIQGEHGTLIPVYQPEALDEYMSGSTSIQAQVQTHTTGRTPAPVPSQQQHSVVTAPVWPGYPAPPHLYTYPVPPTVGAAPSATPPANIQQQQMIHQQIHGQTLQAQTAASWIPSGAVAATHAHTPQHQATTLATATQNASAQYYANTHANAGTASSVVPRGGPHHAHGQTATPERPNAYVNRHPPRRDQGAFHQTRNGHGPGFGSARSPSASRSTSGSASTPRGDYHQNPASYAQRQSQSTPPFQLGFNNKHITDGGLSQQQWMANHQHQQ